MGTFTSPSALVWEGSKNGACGGGLIPRPKATLKPMASRYAESRLAELGRPLGPKTCGVSEKGLEGSGAPHRGFSIIRFVKISAGDGAAYVS